MVRQCRHAPDGPRKTACKAREGAIAWESLLRCRPSIRQVFRWKAKQARRPSTWVVVAGAMIPRAGDGGGRWSRHEAT
eukprot:6086777-Pleurochrysis_carterae.AAC.2